MPRVKTPITKKQATSKITPSLRTTVKQSSSAKKPTKIASSSLDKLGTPRNDKLSVPVYSLLGRATGSLSLPKEIFGAEVNDNLLAQAVRVYVTNQKRFTASTKKRGEVRGSTAKIRRQKGTGRARHGSIRAPIFVGGGIVFGPKPRKVVLDLPKRMKKKALMYALSAKAKDKEIVGLSGLEKASGKTKEISNLLEKLNIKNALIVTGEKMDNVVRGGRNIPGVDILPSNQLNAYQVLKHGSLLITKDAVEKISGGVKK